jgi:hypothetical protein
VAFGSPLSVRGKREGIVEEVVVDDVFFLLVFILVETVGI